MAALKFSRQRESIKENLRSRKDHPTADMVYEDIREIYPNISLGTVYRNLALLTDLGEIRKLTTANGADRYDGNLTPHNHFICRKCGAVLDMRNVQAEEIIRQESDAFPGRIEGCTVYFQGVCKECISRQEEPEETKVCKIRL